MPKEEDILQAIKSQKTRTQKQVRRKALQVMSLIDEEEEQEVQIPTHKTITVGEKQIPVGSTLGPQPLKKLRCKFATKRAREEEIEQIKKEITTKQPPNRVCMREVEQTKDSYLNLVKLHKEYQRVIEK